MPSTPLSTLFTLLLISNNNPRKKMLLYSGPTVSSYCSEYWGAIMVGSQICPFSTTLSLIPQNIQWLKLCLLDLEHALNNKMSRWSGSLVLKETALFILSLKIIPCQGIVTDAGILNQPSEVVLTWEKLYNACSIQTFLSSFLVGLLVTIYTFLLLLQVIIW